MWATDHMTVASVPSCMAWAWGRAGRREGLAEGRREGRPDGRPCCKRPARPQPTVCPARAPPQRTSRAAARLSVAMSCQFWIGSDAAAHSIWRSCGAVMPSATRSAARPSSEGGGASDGARAGGAVSASWVRGLTMRVGHTAGVLRLHLHPPPPRPCAPVVSAGSRNPRRPRLHASIASALPPTSGPVSRPPRLPARDAMNSGVPGSRLSLA
jgi:hypothetical protein